MPVVIEAKARASSLSIEAPVIISNIVASIMTSSGATVMAQPLWNTWACQRLLGIDPVAKLFHNSGAGAAALASAPDSPASAAPAASTSAITSPTPAAAGAAATPAPATGVATAAVTGVATAAVAAVATPMATPAA